MNHFKRELIKREGDIQLLQERIKAGEKEKNLKLEHASLLCKLSNALKGYATVMESQTPPKNKQGVQFSDDDSD